MIPRVKTKQKRSNAIPSVIITFLVCWATYKLTIFIKVVDQESGISTTPDPTGFNQSEWKVQQQLRPTRTINPKDQSICFVSCGYSDTAAELDPLSDVHERYPDFKFFIFTNLHDQEWETPGWEKIITEFTFRRRITHSRYGKFLAWKYDKIRNNCRIVYFMDPVLEPRANDTTFIELAEMIEAYEPGFMQFRHPRKRKSLMKEFEGIAMAKKDNEANLNKSTTWMKAQPDFNDTTNIFLNQCIGYNPRSKIFQELTTSMWERYSLELDSWRDQPLWAFMLRRHKVEPKVFPTSWWKLFKKKAPNEHGHGGHMYQSEEDVRSHHVY